MSDINSLADYIFQKVDEGLKADFVIMDVLERVGSLFGFDNISIKEATDPVSHTIKCTYVWDRDGDSDLLNIEKRYDRDIFEEFRQLNTNPEAFFKVFEFHEGDDDVPRHLIARNMKAMLRIPLIQDLSLFPYL